MQVSTYYSSNLGCLFALDGFSAGLNPRKARIQSSSHGLRSCFFGLTLECGLGAAHERGTGYFLFAKCFGTDLNPLKYLHTHEARLEILEPIVREQGHDSYARRAFSTFITSALAKRASRLAFFVAT